MMRFAFALCLACTACGSSSPNNNNPDLSYPPGTDLAMGPPVAIHGTAIDTTGGGGGGVPVAGATVTVPDTALSTTTAADGSFTLMASAGSAIFVRVDAANYQSLQVGMVVPAGGGTISLTMLPTAKVQQVTNSLSPPLTLDTSKGDVIVSFNSVDNNPGYGATSSAQHGNTFSITGNGVAVYSSTTTGQKTLIFPNTPTGTTTVTVSGPSGRTCTLRDAITNWRVDANVFTFVIVQCT